MQRVPRTMSTQHPDNVTLPFFASSQPLAGDDEVTEAYYAFSHLGCEEQMWDFEGKEVDEHVVRKLLSRFPDFFRANPLGERCFLTFRVPNPTVERTEGKVLLEVLESIPRAYDVARRFSPEAPPPVFEVILPMTTSATEVERVREYYARFVASKGSFEFSDGSRLRDWIGEFLPESISVIPLFEDMQSLLHAADIVEEYLATLAVPHQRVFLARSDPALNYGHLAAILALKVSLHRLDRLERRLGIPILPILGVGSCPFRGNFKPTNTDNCLRGYPSVQTFTIQSAYKYDWPVEVVREAVARINATARGPAIPVEDEERVIELAARSAATYQAALPRVAQIVGDLARSVPQRRARKLHVGLFGYARAQDAAFHLPRAISFCAAMYSIGLPPELLSYTGLSANDIALARGVYPDLEADLGDAARYFNPKALELLPDLAESVRAVADRFAQGIDEDHQALTSEIIDRYRRGESPRELIVHAASLRGFLG